MNQHLPRVVMAGLNSESRYRIRELNRIDKYPLSFEGQVFSGAYLMANGLEIPYNHNVDKPQKNEYSSRVLYLEEVDKYLSFPYPASLIFTGRNVPALSILSHTFLLYNECCQILDSKIISFEIEC